MARYAQPVSLDEALSLLAAGAWTPLAGGTDFYPALGPAPAAGAVLDISRIAGLRGIARGDGGWRLGALTTWTDIARAEALPPAFGALRQAAREVGSVQIQNRATLAGNLCNASPAADGVPALLVLDVEVELASHAGRRRLALADYIEGNRRTARRPDELVTAVLVPDAAATGASAFFKLGARRYLVISMVMAAARLALDGGGRIAAAAVSVGACSAVAQRLGGLERDLAGARPEDAAGRIAASHFAGLAPIDDIRSPAAYRLEAAREAVVRALAGAAEALS